MKKPSILIFSQAMELGGVERSLLGLLDSIDHEPFPDAAQWRVDAVNPKANFDEGGDWGRSYAIGNL